MFVNIFLWLPASWQLAEPIIGYTLLILGIIYWVRVQIARRRRYTNRGVKNFIIALQVGRPVAEAVKSYFGEIDHLVKIEEVIGRTQLENQQDYQKLAKEIYRACAANQNCPIKLVLSGPVGLSFLIGQLVGLAKFDVEVFQFDPITKGYLALPEPDRTWLN